MKRILPIVAIVLSAIISTPLVVSAKTSSQPSILLTSDPITSQTVSFLASYQFQVWVDAEEAQRAADEAAAAEVLRIAQAVTQRPIQPSTPPPTGTSWDTFAACVIAHESGGNPTAANPTSSASGLFQDLDSTWGGYGGYARAADAPVSVQYERNYALWNGGAGAGHWAGTGC